MASRALPTASRTSGGASSASTSERDRNVVIASSVSLRCSFSAVREASGRASASALSRRSSCRL